MITYLFIGLVIVLAVYLVRGRRARASSDVSAPSRGRISFRSPKAPAPAPTAEPTPLPSPAPLRAEASPPGPRTAGPTFAPPVDWTPEETIVEPGWPLPGEISGSWSSTMTGPESTPFPAGVDSPVAVVEWAPAAGADDDALPATEAAPDLPSAEEWAMPDAQAPPDDDLPSGPPLWVPGEFADPDPPAVDEPVAVADPVWLSVPSSELTALEEAAVAVWQTEAPVADDVPALAWDTESAPAEPEQPIWLADAEPDSEDAEEPPVFVWADAGESASPPQEHAPVWEPLPVEPEPVAEVEPEPEVEPEAEVEIEAPAFSPDLSWSPPSEAVVEPEEQPAEETPLAEQSAAIADLVPTLLDGFVPFTRVCDRLGVTPRMLALMRVLDETPLSVTEQAHTLAVSRPLVADLSTRLESMGFARRERVAEDRRRVRIALTDSGRKVCRDAAASPQPEQVETVLRALTPAERAQLLSGLQALATPPV